MFNMNMYKHIYVYIFYVYAYNHEYIQKIREIQMWICTHMYVFYYLFMIVYSLLSFYYS